MVSTEDLILYKVICSLHAVTMMEESSATVVLQCG